MGRKNKKGGGDDDLADQFKEGDFSRKFISQKQAEEMEAQAAQRNVDDDVVSKKQSKKKKKGGEDLDADFDNAVQKDVKKADDSDGAEKDLQDQMDENFEGIGKRNTRKKKNKQQNMYGGNDGVMDDLAGAFDEGADSDEIHAKKGKKGNKDKKEKHQGKKKKQQKEESEEETKEEAEEEVVEEEDTNEYPLNILYCEKCGMPPEYCQFANKDVSACKQWLQSASPALYTEIYGEAPEEGEKTEDTKEEEKKEGEEEEKKPKKKVKFEKNAGIVTVYKLKRGGRKIICLISGMEYYTKDLKGLCSKFGKKFSCGCNMSNDDIYGDCVQIQGDVEDRLLEFLQTDKDMQKLAIPEEKIIFEDKGNQKGRKRGPPK